MMVPTRLAVVVISLIGTAAIPLAAQQNGGHGVDHAGVSGRGGAMVSRPSPHISMSHPGLARTPGFMAGHSPRVGESPAFRSGFRRNGYMSGRFRAPGLAEGGSRYHGRNFDHSRDHRNPYRPAYGYPGVYAPTYLPWSGWSLVGWPGSDLLDSPDNYSYDQGGYPDQTAPAQYSDVQAGPPPESQAPPTQPATYDPLHTYREPYLRQPSPQAEPQEQDALTVVFKDGRPSEQIHNYMLTRTTLYIQDGRMREIPLDQIDIPGTQKANESAGISFRVPG